MRKRPPRLDKYFPKKNRSADFCGCRTHFGQRIIPPSALAHATLPLLAAQLHRHTASLGLINVWPTLDARVAHCLPVLPHSILTCLHKCSTFPHLVLCCDSAARGYNPHCVPASCGKTLACSTRSPLRSTHHACVLIVLCSSNSPSVLVSQVFIKTQWCWSKHEGGYCPQHT